MLGSVLSSVACMSVSQSDKLRKMTMEVKAVQTCCSEHHQVVLTTMLLERHFMESLTSPKSCSRVTRKYCAGIGLTELLQDRTMNIAQKQIRRVPMNTARLDGFAFPGQAWRRSWKTSHNKVCCVHVT